MSRLTPSPGAPLPYRCWHVEETYSGQFYEECIPHFATQGEALEAVGDLTEYLALVAAEEGETSSTVPNVVQVNEPCLTLTCRCGQYDADASGEGSTHFQDSASIDELLSDLDLERDEDGFITCESAGHNDSRSHCPHQVWHLEPGVFNKNRWVCDGCREVLVLGPVEAPVGP